MFTTVYFPLVSTLATSCMSDDVLELLRAGKLAHAAASADACADSDDGELSPLCMQLQADLQLTLGVDVDAEESYRRSQKMIRGSKAAMRSASCRNAGWQAFFLHRLCTAMSCFSRVAEEPDVDAGRRLEARFGTLAVLYELGHLSEASEALDQIEAELDDSVQDAVLAEWRQLVLTLRFDLAVQRELRSMAALSDHVYWQSGFVGDASLLGIDGGDHTEACARATAAVATPLLRGRIQYLNALRRLAHGERREMPALLCHLDWASSQGMGAYQRSTRLEIALAALAAEAPQLADTVLSPLTGDHRGAAQGHRQLEYLYCMAKTRQAQGRSHESLQLYSRYALSAMQCLRDESQALAPRAQRNARRNTQLDDVSARLPAKYRRAYRYLLDNLDRGDLSVREVAAEVGVTERALQSAFKNSLGATPTEIIRQQRMERIRAELQADNYRSEQGVLGAAIKWGVRNRSTLVNGYRRQFNEAPSETLAR